jgi:hypothetical protein
VEVLEKVEIPGVEVELRQVGGTEAEGTAAEGTAAEGTAAEGTGAEWGAFQLSYDWMDVSKFIMYATTPD